ARGAVVGRGVRARGRRPSLRVGGGRQAGAPPVGAGGAGGARPAGEGGGGRAANRGAPGLVVGGPSLAPAPPAPTRSSWVRAPRPPIAERGRAGRGCADAATPVAAPAAAAEGATLGERHADAPTPTTRRPWPARCADP